LNEAHVNAFAIDPAAIFLPPTLSLRVELSPAATAATVSAEDG
jgi:hypothetical protein